MNATASELLMHNFDEIFIELDPVKRAALLAEYYAEDCLWIHPGGRIVGRDGINAAASEIRKQFRDYRYTVTGEIQAMHNVATCRWGSGMPGQPFHYTGTDFLEERDGHVARLYTFIDSQPPQGTGEVNNEFLVKSKVCGLSPQDAQQLKTSFSM